jgi:hypothetical protein
MAKLNVGIPFYKGMSGDYHIHDWTYTKEEVEFIQKAIKKAVKEANEEAKLKREADAK